MLSFLASSAPYMRPGKALS